MRVLAICQDELVIRIARRGPAAQLRGRVPRRKPAARPPPPRRRDDSVTAGDPRRIDTYLKADISPSTCVIVEDNGRRSLKKMLDGDPRRRRHARLRPGIRHAATASAPSELHGRISGRHATFDLPELSGRPLLTEFSRSLTRARVQQYQRYFSDADRVLILLHNDPDPDAMASGLALRNVLRRTKTTAIIGAMQGVTRPENLRMVNLLDIHVEAITPASLAGIRPHRDGRRAAALLRRPDRPRRPRHRSPSRAAGLHRGLQGHPRRLRLDVARSSPSTCAPST